MYVPVPVAVKPQGAQEHIPAVVLDVLLSKDTLRHRDGVEAPTISPHCVAMQVLIQVEDGERCPSTRKTPYKRAKAYRFVRPGVCCKVSVSWFPRSENVVPHAAYHSAAW